MASHNDKTSVVDADSHFIIDPVTRTIQENDGEKKLVQFDHNSERKTFECPRYVEGHDMLNCNRVIVNYLDNDLPGVYEVDDLTMKDSNTVMFSWLISSNATQKTGNIFFAITFMCVQTNGDVTYRWNTAINKGLKVIEGMNQNSTIVYDNVDILEQWKQQLFGTSDGEISKIQEATNECLKQIPSDYRDLNAKVGANTKSISELKESIGNVNEEISGLKGVGSGLTTEQKRYIVSLFKSAVYSENMSDMVTALEDSFNTIPATGIKLSPTTIKFSGIGDTQKITATLTSDTATSSILWESNNTDVVTVKDGVATAVSDGIATITATSGSATAKCNVTVNTKELYSISNKVCNADFYEATGLKLGSDSANGYAKSWTLLANYSTKANDVVSGMNASEKNALQFGTNGANNSQNYWLKNGIPTTKYQNDNYANWCFAITHDANSNDIVFYEYVNDELKTSTVHPGFNTPNSDVYNGELYIGGTTSAGYVGTIYNFDIVMRIMTRDEITTLLKGGVY